MQLSDYIVDQQDDFIIIDKPAGVNFHDEESVGQGIFNQVKTQLGFSELYPVHRLDKMTSGLLIFAKTLAAAQAFQELFAAHEVEKYYLALSEQKPSKKQGLIKGDMQKSRRGAWKLERSQNNPAITQFFSYGLGQGTRCFLLKPHSGKTHQIRVAMKSLGAAIIGDPLYNGQSNSDRGYLHAYGLKFSLWGQEYSYQLLPKQGVLFNQSTMCDQLNELGAPWQLAWPKVK